MALGSLACEARGPQCPGEQVSQPAPCTLARPAVPCGFGQTTCPLWAQLPGRSLPDRDGPSLSLHWGPLGLFVPQDPPLPHRHPSTRLLGGVTADRSQAWPPRVTVTGATRVFPGRRAPHGRGSMLPATARGRRGRSTAPGASVQPPQPHTDGQAPAPAQRLTSFLLKYFRAPSRSVSTNFRLRNCPLSRPRFQRKPSRYPGGRGRRSEGTGNVGSDCHGAGTPVASASAWGDRAGDP